MRNYPQITISTIFHLSEKYFEQYVERNLDLSPEQNEASFRDFVNQYYNSLYWGNPISLVIDPDVPLF